MTTQKRSRRSLADYLDLPSLILALVRWMGPKAVLLWVLLLLVMASIASGLANLVTGLRFGYLFLTATMAITVAWGAATLPMRARLAAALSVLLGMTFLLVRVGGLGGDLFRVARAAFVLLIEIIAWPWFGPPRVVTILAPWRALIGVWNDMATLLQRPLTWLWAILQGRGAFDPVASTLTWGLGMWLCSSWAGWVTRRHTRPLLGVLPGGGLVAFLLAYTGSKPPILLPIIGLTLILMALMRQWTRERRWEQQHIDYSHALWQDMMVVALLVAVVTVSLAAVAPALSLNKVVRWVREYTAGEGQPPQVSESMGLEIAPAEQEPSPFQEAQRTGLPREHLIGSGPELSEDVVMIIQTGAPARATLPDAAPYEEPSPRYYWRSVAYDIYTGVGWRTSGIQAIAYEDGEYATRPDMTHRRRVRQEVETVREMGGLVYVAGALMAIDQPYKIAWRPPQDIFAATIEAEVYRADSSIPVVTEEQLRADDGAYPDWVVERYLKLPDSTPDRVLELAQNLTATAPTFYDRARAIEQYLRGFPYTLEVPRTPPGWDIADFFIFDLQRGYCDYYATTMVVLARAAGLPARLVVGYASGDYDAERARYIVTEADAHAWVEVYFPTYGWIEFEPTAGRAGLDRASEADEARWAEDEVTEPLVPRTADEPGFRLRRWLLLSLALVVALIFMASVIDALWLLSLAPPALMRRLYHRLGRYGRRLNVHVEPGATPYEFHAAFMRRWEEYPHLDRLRSWFDPMLAEVAAVIECYVQVFYTPIALEDSRGIVLTWWRLRWRLGLYGIYRQVRRYGLLAPSGPPLVRSEELPRPPIPRV